MSSFADAVLWVYIVVLVAGGVFGYYKAGSKVSLITAGISAAVLALCALPLAYRNYLANGVLIALVVVFAIRLTKTKKFMPSGLMLVLTLLALALHIFPFKR